jgi:uncharacterized protein involved in exopolysaccharide biosynthesis
MQTYATAENAQLVQAQQELDGLRAQLAKLGGSEDSASSLIVPKGKVPEAGLEYVRKLRDVKYYETIFDILARQYEVAKLDEAKEGAIIQVVDPAIVPDKKSFPRIWIFFIVGLIAGLLAGIVSALISAAMENMKSDSGISAKLRYLRKSLSWKQYPVS